MENLVRILSKLPIVLIGAIVCAYLYWDYYNWRTDPQSELGQKKAQIATAKKDVDVLKAKFSSGEDFLKNLDAIRDRIRALTVQLEATKSSLNSELDIASFVRIITLEVKKLGFQIKSIKPEAEEKSDYYYAEPFTVTFRGAYIQLLVFMDRVSKFQQVIRISNFSMHPSGNNLTKYVELEARVRLMAYKYIGSAADDVIHKDSMKDKEREQWSK